MLIGLPNLYDRFLIARFIAVAVILAIVFLFALIRKKRWLAPNTPVFLCYLLFLIFCGCSIFWATNTAEALFAFSCQLLSPLIIVIAHSLLSSHRQFTQKVLWAVASVVLSVYLLFAIVQLFHIENFSYGQLYRVSGINGHKNLLAAMLFVLSAFLPISFSIFESKLPKWISVGLLALSLAVIILLKSRAVLLSAIVAAIVFGIMMLTKKRRCRKRTQALTLITTIVVVYAFLTMGLRQFAICSVPKTSEKSEFETKITSTSSLVERCLLWDKTYQIADQRPWTGHGVGNWQIHFPDAGLEGLYRADVWNVNFTKPHNEYLGVLAETGYPGLLLEVFFLVGLILKAFFKLRETANKNEFLFGTIVLSVFVGSCVNALFDFPNSRIEHIVWMGVLMAINHFREAYRHAPYCKENLNDLGLVEYYSAHDLDRAIGYLNEAIRISPNYLYPHLNLAYIYLNEGQPQKARTVIDGVYFDEHKRDVLKADAPYFEPFNTEAARQKIDADYEAFMQLKSSFLFSF